MYPKLALSRDVHSVSFLASRVKLTILVIAITYMSMTYVKNTISSLDTSLPHTFHRPPCDDILVGVGWLKSGPRLCSPRLTAVSITAQ